MNITKFQESAWGALSQIPGGGYAFVPNHLPPTFNYTFSLINLLSRADSAVGQLSGLGRNLPNPFLLIIPYVRREAVLSSRIEGTQSSLSDLFLFEPSTPEKHSDVLEVNNYVTALDKGITRLEKIPLSLRLVKELHEILMRDVSGERQTPGEFRRSQNWIGPPGCKIQDSLYVPPPVPQMAEALDRWEKFLHDRDSFPPLIQCAMMHYQFEAIHPFLDGNGRIGRLLIMLFLCERKALSQPLLYLSAFFEKYRDEYYRRLLAVSREGDWEGWISFFLRGVASQAEEAICRSERILSLYDNYRKQAPTKTLRLIDAIFENPYIQIRKAKKILKVSYPTAQKYVKQLVELGILDEISEKGDFFHEYCAKEILKAFEEPMPNAAE